MSRDLRQNTATIVTVGPFFDKTDGVTLETGLTITNERITFTVDDPTGGAAPTLVLDNVTGATSGTSNDLNYITNCDAALMQLELAAANVNYVGRAVLTITDAANHCPVFHFFNILTQEEFDAKYGTGNRRADVIAISGDSGAADNCEAMFDGTGYAGGTAKLGIDVVNWKGSAAPAMTGDAYAAVVARLLPLAIATGTVQTSGGANTASSFYTDLAGGDDFWNDCLILITSGALAQQVKEIGDFADTNGVVTLTSGQAFTATPADGVTFAIINR